MNIGAVSEPPINPSPGVRPERTTFADVFMKLAHDGLNYATIILIGVLTMRGVVTGNEAVMGLMASLMAKLYPNAIQIKQPMGNVLRGMLPLLAAGAAVGVGVAVAACRR